MNDESALADPRVFPDPYAASPDDSRLHALASESLAADSRQRSDAVDVAIRAEFDARLRSGGAALASVFASASSVAVTRHLWRQLDAAWQESLRARHTKLAFAVFALPVVIIAGTERANHEPVHDGILGDPDALAAVLLEYAALGGSQTIALANVLASPDAIDLPRLGELFAWQEPEASNTIVAPRSLVPSPLAFPAGREGVHLRFIVGCALAPPGRDLLADHSIRAWGVPFTKALSRELSVADASVLALPRAPQRPLAALQSGRAAQREVGAQIFASNAIRKLRASVGEPSAVISAHRAPDAPGGGELRLSLSSPFAPRDAEGFRCPIYPIERTGDVAAMLVALLADCRVTDVQFAAGVHADRDPATGLTLLFKPDTLPDSAAMH